MIYLYCTQCVIHYFNMSLAARKNFCVSHVRVLQARGVCMKQGRILNEDGDIDRSVSVSESPEDKRDL